MSRAGFLSCLLAAAALCAPAATHYITVSGLGGEADYEQRFTSWAATIDQVLRGSRLDAKTITLTGAEATRERLRKVLEDAVQDSGPNDAFVLMLIGHGTYDGVDYKFNIPGPDITDAELAGYLNRLRAGRQLVVIMTSSSGGALERLRKEGRVLVVATKSGTEKNATVFARYWAEALRDPSADTDKNEAITALEAFRYAALKSAAFYDSQKRLATEHPLLEETGTGEGLRVTALEEGQGRLAAAFTLLRFGSAQEAVKDPAKQKLLARKEELESQIDLLKYQKAAMTEPEYRKQLTALLLELARTQEALDK
ncbi:MAG: caspase family protein [Bryobacterales bacterium]|nr:caspase family protein [Bryobacterales bacterium]